MYLLRSATPETHSARALLQNFSVVPYRDGIFAARQATNSLRQNRPFLQTSCSFPDSTSSPPSLDRGLTCQPGTVNNLTRGATYTPSANTSAPRNASRWGGIRRVFLSINAT